MLNFVTINWQNYCGCGVEYTNRLFDGIRRNLNEETECKFIVFTDNLTEKYADGIEVRMLPFPDLIGWWQKCSLFIPSLFSDGDRVVWMDLDTIILGNIRDIAEYRGDFAILRDPFFPQHHGSAVMAWKPGYLDHIWTTWDKGGRPQFDPRGDQRWIETMQPKADFWQDMFPGIFLSYKAHIRPIGYVPERTRVVIFHGKPKPHELDWSLKEMENA